MKQYLKSALFALTALIGLGVATPKADAGYWFESTAIGIKNGGYTWTHNGDTSKLPIPGCTLRPFTANNGSTTSAHVYFLDFIYKIKNTNRKFILSYCVGYDSSRPTPKVNPTTNNLGRFFASDLDVRNNTHLFSGTLITIFPYNFYIFPHESEYGSGSENGTWDDVVSVNWELAQDPVDCLYVMATTYGFTPVGVGTPVHWEPDGTGGQLLDCTTLNARKVDGYRIETHYGIPTGTGIDSFFNLDVDDIVLDDQQHEDWHGWHLHYFKNKN